MLCKRLFSVIFLKQHNAECDYYILFIIFGIIFFIEDTGIWVLRMVIGDFICYSFHLINLDFFSLNENHILKNLLAGVEKVDIFFSYILRPSVNDPLHSYYLKI